MAQGPINAVLLDRLLTQHEMVTIHALAGELNQPIDRVLLDIERLVQAGCLLQRHPQQGVMLQCSGLAVWADYLKWADRNSQFSRTYEVYGKIGSTQDAARRLIEGQRCQADGAIVAADCQDAGRGRLGRSWFAPAGTGVLFSRCCVQSGRTTIPPTDGLVLAASVAIAAAVEQVTDGLSVAIKWPNDILVGGRKLGGILVECFSPRRPTSPDAPSGRAVESRAAVIGIGINVDLGPEQIPAQLRLPMTSLSMCGQRIDRLAVLSESIRQLDAALAMGPDELLEQWRRRSPIMSQRVRLQSSGRYIEGQVIDLDPNDGLIVRTDVGSIVHLPSATTTYV